MSPSSHTAEPGAGRARTILLAAVFLIVAIAGLSYVKWWPYYGKALKAAAEHTLGSSILTGETGKTPEPSLQAALDYASAYFKAVWKAAVLGILLGSLVQVLVPTRWLLRTLGQAGFKSTAVGALAAVPGMMCSCCAAPIAVGLRKKNVSVGAALAFWIGNPLLNPATLIFMAFVLNWKFTVMRIVFGLALTLGVSYFANRFAGDQTVPEPAADSAFDADEDNRPLLLRWLASMGRMLVAIVPAYLVAVLLLGAVRAWLFPSLDAGALSGVLMVVLFAVAGTLFVIPTAAEIPIIGTFLSLGFGTGVAGALLVTLPAVSLPSLLMVYRSFPRRVVWLLVGAVVAAGVLAGAAGAVFL
ncbi:permease [Paenibacillus spiritus]|uniref:Permease n=1 Tax=Paenibacillus spiritus TaxID=2496557 RepID=A0A5J5G9Q4_9BACL|nr:permease [Paenibacillus spiritus]KAA9004183.1 permease [Paenibacillus spiritus]